MPDDLLGTVKKALEGYERTADPPDAGVLPNAAYELVDAPNVRDMLRALVARCTTAEANVVKANAGFEEYERKYYLATDRCEQAEADLTVDAAVSALAAEVRSLRADLDDMARQRDQWKEFAFKNPELTPPVVTQELLALLDRCKQAECERDAARVVRKARDADVDRLKAERTALLARCATAEAEVGRLEHALCLSLDVQPLTREWVHEQTERAEKAEAENAALRQGLIPADWLAMHIADKRMNDNLRDEVKRLREAIETVLHNDQCGMGKEWDTPCLVRSLIDELTALRARLATAMAENSDLRALLDEARSHNPEKYRSSSDDSGTHGAVMGESSSPASDATRVAPSGEGSGQPIVREGWCPHCGVVRIEDYSGEASEAKARLT